MEATSDSSAARRLDGRPFVLVLLCALAVRAGFIAVSFPALQADPDGYRLIAGVLREHGIYGRPVRGEPDRILPTAYRPPLYPLVLASLGGDPVAPPLQVAVLHVALGVATVGLVWLVSVRYVSRRVAWCAAAIVAVDPILLNQSAQVMTETLAALLATLVVASLDWMVRTRRYESAIVAGVVIGVAALCRPTFLPLVPLVVLVTACLPNDRTRQLGLAATVMLIAALVMAPWVIRNRIVFGRWIATTTHGGYTLLLGNNPDYYRYLREGTTGEVWSPESEDQLMDECRARAAPSELPPAGTIAAELVDDQLAYRCAQQLIRQQPGTFAWACVYRVGQFWSPLPHARSESESWRGRLVRYLVGAWYVAVLGSAAVGCWRIGRRLIESPWCWSGVVILGFVAAHTAYWSNLRMRGPVMPLIALVAGVGIHYLLSHRQAVLEATT